jgi:hypothetical protein
MVKREWVGTRTSKVGVSFATSQPGVGMKGHLVIEAQVVTAADQDAGHLALGGEAVDALDGGVVVVSDLLVGGAPFSQQHEQGTLCPIPHKVNRLLIV